MNAPKNKSIQGKVDRPSRDFMPRKTEERLVPLVDYLIEGDRPTTPISRFFSLHERNADNAFFVDRLPRACEATSSFTAEFDRESGASLEELVALQEDVSCNGIERTVLRIPQRPETSCAIDQDQRGRRPPMLFSSEFLIRFSHCDPAGIVYFANFFDMINAVVEDWFSQALGTPFQSLHADRNVSFPVVSTQCEFSSPCRLGDKLALELSVAHLGQSSLTLTIRGRVAREEKLRARHTIAMISLDSYRAVAIPEDLRARIGAYVEEAPAPG
ncbi:MAG: acyl-CoA thioesterase [Deltaproteobacteria bacterium]|nr:acyl-CoA thioesterase [Deltaproteobacteria bacterium]